MKHLLIIFSLLVTTISWSKDVEMKDLVFRDGLYFEEFSNEPFNGKVIGLLQGKIKKGKKEGEWQQYNLKNGMLDLIMNFKNGKLHGELIEYYDGDATIRLKGLFKDGKHDKEWFYYDLSNKLEKKEIYKNGKLEKTTYSSFWKNLFKFLR